MLSFFRKKTEPQAAKSVQQDTIKRGWIAVDDLRPGMFITELDRPWEETPFLFQRFSVDTEADIATVRKVCERVHVEYQTGNIRPLHRPAPATLGEMAEDIDQSQRFFQRAQQSTSELFDELRLSNSLNVEQVKAVVDDCVDQVLHNRDAALWLTHIRRQNENDAQHALNGMSLAVILGSQDNLLKNELRDLATCALLHDVGKIRLPASVTSASATRDTQAQAKYRSHVTHGRDILLSSRNLYSGAADVAFSHHEQVDGGGFPRGLNGDQIPRFAKMVAIVNLYDNLLHCDQQAHQAASAASSGTATKALRRLYGERERSLDGNLVTQFIAAVGIYPPGSIVEMDSGEVGLVLSSAPSDRLRPRVILVLDSGKNAIKQRVIDLSHSPGDERGQPYAIRQSLPDGSYGIQIQDFLRAGLRIEGLDIPS